MVRVMDAPIGKKAQSTYTVDSDIPNRYIRCPECGEEIQMVPTLTDMITAIEDHFSIHREQAKTDLAIIQINEPLIRENLSAQVVIKAPELCETPKDATLIKLE
jgi:DNA-directed RNA polymerase subunit RPC12/RpoP